VIGDWCRTAILCKTTCSHFNDLQKGDGTLYPLSSALFEGKFPEGTAITADAKGDEIVFTTAGV